MKKSVTDTVSIGLGDRIVTGLLSGIFSAITLVCYFFIAHSWHSWKPNFIIFREFVSFEVGLYIVGISVFLGFLLGSERISSIFGFFWGASR